MGEGDDHERLDDDEREQDGRRDPSSDDPRYELLGRTERRALDRAQDRWMERERDAHRVDADGTGTESLRWPGDGTSAICGVKVKKGVWAGKPCQNTAGDKTTHLGFGPCWAHAGALKRGRAEGAWVAAHAFAQQLNINPWDALLMAVRIAAGKVAYCELVLGQASSDLELEGRVERLTSDDGTSLLINPDDGSPLGVGDFRDRSFWVKQSELWHDRLAKTAKMAVDAGIAAYEIQRVEAEAQRMARVLNAVIEGLEGKISETVALEMRAIMRGELLRIEEEETRMTGEAPGALSGAPAGRNGSNLDRAVVDSTGTWED